MVSRTVNRNIRRYAAAILILIIITLILFNIRFYFRENEIIHTTITRHHPITELKRNYFQPTLPTMTEWKKQRDDMFHNVILPRQRECQFPPWDQKDRLIHSFVANDTKQPSTREIIIGNNHHHTDNDATPMTSPSDDHPVIRRRRLSQSHQRQICFIHIGKTAGTNIDCNLRIAYKVNPICNRHRKQISYKSIFRETGAISPQTTCRWHLSEYEYRQSRQNRNHRKFRNYESYLISIRNPVDRILSSYLFDHLTIRPRREDDITCGMAMIYSCFTRFNDLATLGLDGPRPSSFPFRYPVRMDLTQDECKSWAWGFVQGDAAGWRHNFFNYNYYTRLILSYDVTKEIFVIRAEHLWDDWMAIDKLVGGNGDLPSNWNESMNENVNVTRHDREISSRGMSNVCRALCDEIQIYKQLLDRAVNLSPEDVEESLLELKRVCPEEGSLMKRKCIY